MYGPNVAPTSMSSNESRNKEVKASDKSTPLMEEMTFSPRANSKTPNLMTIKEQTEMDTKTPTPMLLKESEKPTIAVSE